MATIQHLLDELAEQLQRSATVDSPRGRLIASSRHYGDEDAPRIEVLLNRDLDDSVAEYLYSHKIRSSDDMAIIPARPELKLKARCCYPLRRGRRLLGFLWLIDGKGPDELVLPYVRRLSEALGEEVAADDAEANRRNELAGEILRGDRQSAVAELRDRGFAEEGRRIRVVAAIRNGETDVGTDVLSETAAVEAWCRPGRDVVEASLGGIPVLICDVGSEVDDGVEVMCARLADELPGAGFGIGISDAGDLCSVRALHRRAVLSACACLVFDHLPPAASWENLYPERMLVEAGVTLSDAAQFPPEMAPLFQPANSVLLETVEAYLDRGGDRTATSEALFIHRSTLYYRLSQVQKLTGIDPTDGHRRLGLHIAIRLQRVLQRGIADVLHDEEILPR